MSSAKEILERAITECSDVTCAHRAMSQALAALDAEGVTRPTWWKLRKMIMDTADASVGKDYEHRSAEAEALANWIEQQYGMQLAIPLPGQSGAKGSAGLREAAAEVVNGITALTPDSYCVRVPRSAWQALRAALRAERDEAKAAANEASTALADALARVEALEAALLECAQDLASEVNHAYGVHREPVHPSQQWKYERDMEPVARARALLEQKP